jgi:hypothetical protein
MGTGFDNKKSWITPLARICNPCVPDGVHVTAVNGRGGTGCKPAQAEFEGSMGTKDFKVFKVLKVLSTR